jgi:thioredoxin-related protein
LPKRTEERKGSKEFNQKKPLNFKDQIPDMKRLLCLSIVFYSLIAHPQPAALGNITTTATAQVANAPESAQAIMKEACVLAGQQGKQVIVIFHASWCGWCHKMENSINDPACKKFFDDHYVIRYMVVDESDDKKNLENPGANEMRNKYNGAGQGIPFWLVFDKDGKLLADSKMRKAGEGPEAGTNTGCPANADEVAFFMTILKKTTGATDGEMTGISERFRKNE